jgi:hypothetical protein
MPVTADSYEAKAIELAATMLAASASFRAAVGAASASAAKAFIVETTSGLEVDSKTGIGTAMDGSDLDLAVPPYAIIGLDPGLDVEAGGVGYVDYMTVIVVRLVLKRVGTGQNPAEGSRDAWNLAGKVRAEMQAQVGGANAFADAEVATAGLAMDEENVHRDHSVAQLTITSRG